MPLDYFITFLDSRKDWLEAVCVSGGEPLLEDDLEVLLRVIKDRDMLVKLDTNGSRPERLAELVGAKLVDNIAMDVKAPLHRYKQVTRSEVSEDDIARSIEFVRTSGLPYTFRTTVVPGLVGRRTCSRSPRCSTGPSASRSSSFRGGIRWTSFSLRSTPTRRKRSSGWPGWLSHILTKFGSREFEECRRGGEAQGAGIKGTQNLIRMRMIFVPWRELSFVSP